MKTTEKSVIVLSVLLIMGIGFWTYRGLNKKYQSATATTEQGRRQIEELQEIYTVRAEAMQKWIAETSTNPQIAKNLTALKTKISTAGSLELKTQEDFDRFDQVQNEISNEFAEFIQNNEKNVRPENTKISHAKLMDFERLELSLVRKRQDYHLTAFSQRDLINQANRLPRALFPRVEPLPVFAAELMLHDQMANSPNAGPATHL